MKYLLFITILLPFGCQNTSNINKPAKLSQKVATTIHGTISSSNYPNMVIENKGQQHTAKIQNGEFTLDLMLDEPGIYTLRYGRRSSQVFLNPGDKLSFSTTANQFSQVMNFEGDRAVENSFLTDKFNKDISARSLKVNTYKLEEQEFVDAVQKTRTENLQAFKTFAESNTLDPYFTFLIDTEIEYEWASDRLIYPRYHEFYAKKQNFVPSPVYFDFQRDLDLDDAAKMISPNFNSFISFYADIEAGKILEKEEQLKISDNGLALTKFKIINERFKNQEIKEYLMYNTLKTHIKYEGANGTPTLIETFDKSCSNLTYKNDIQKDYANWKSLETGNIAPTFAYSDIDGKLHDIANYKGKYIYVDVWATWCGPCKKELPHLEKLQEQYKDNDKILFTSVSIDKDKQAWERMVKDKNMQGLQLFAENEWRASIVKDYKISGIPRFLLIDDQGKIISANAPRPSSQRIKAQLAAMLEKDIR